MECRPFERRPTRGDFRHGRNRTTPRAQTALRMFLVAALAVCGCVDGERQAEDARAASLAVGAEVYVDHCAGCHGENGDGQGPAAALLLAKPRDFRTGTFKFRSTPGGPPTDADLLRVVTRGISYTAMQSYGALPLDERVAVVQYVVAFASRPRGDAPTPPLELPPEPPDAGTLAAVQKGRAAYERGMCRHCHGVRGDAKGVMARLLIDDSGHNTRPADFTLGMFKSGPDRSDIVRTVMAGLGGTPMASFAAVLREGEAGFLSDYLRSLARPVESREHWAALLLARDYPAAFSAHVGEPTPEVALALAARGREIDAEKRCITCHVVGATPARRSNDWHVAHFAQPRSVVPLSRMPAYPTFVGDDGQPTADGLAMIAHLQATAAPDVARVAPAPAQHRPGDF